MFRSLYQFRMTTVFTCILFDGTNYLVMCLVQCAFKTREVLLQLCARFGARSSRVCTIKSFDESSRIWGQCQVLQQYGGDISSYNAGNIDMLPWLEDSVYDVYVLWATPIFWLYLARDGHVRLCVIIFLIREWYNTSMLCYTPGFSAALYIGSPILCTSIMSTCVSCCICGYSNWWFWVRRRICVLTCVALSLGINHLFGCTRFISHLAQAPCRLMPVSKAQRQPLQLVELCIVREKWRWSNPRI